MSTRQDIQQPARAPTSIDVVAYDKGDDSVTYRATMAQIVNAGLGSSTVTVNLAHGGTASDLSATGPGVVVQGSASAALTVIAPSDSMSIMGATSPGTAPQWVEVAGAGVSRSGNTFTFSSGSTSFANPTASVGLTAVNGTAATAMRSDAAPNINQATNFSFSNLGSTTITANGATSAPALSLTGTIDASSTVAQLLIQPAGVTAFSGSSGGTLYGGNASTGFAGNLLDLQVAGTSKGRIDKDGAFWASGTSGGNSTAYNFANDSTTGIRSYHGLVFYAAGQDGLWLTDGSGSGGGPGKQVQVDASCVLTWNNSTFTGAVDTGIARSSAGVVEINTGTPGAFAALRFGQPTTSTIACIAKAIASRTAPLLQFQTSAGASLGNVGGGCIDDVFVDVANTMTATFESIHITTLPANALIVNGDKLAFKYILTVASGETVDFELSFGGVAFWQTPISLIFSSAGVVEITGYIIRATSTTARAEFVFTQSGSASMAVVAPFYVTESVLTGLTFSGSTALVILVDAHTTVGSVILVQGTVAIDSFGS